MISYRRRTICRQRFCFICHVPYRGNLSTNICMVSRLLESTRSSSSPQFCHQELEAR